ncbi:MAG: MBL fold metallo-hydrolase, partial [Candidatus Margulisiibacteriota bacterium]
HGVETFGFVIKGKNNSISYVADTKYYPELAEQYENDIIIINMLLPYRMHYQHLCVEDAAEIIRALKPKQAILTHFGGRLIEAGPEKIAEQLSRELKTEIIAARDGMAFELGG